MAGVRLEVPWAKPPMSVPSDDTIEARFPRWRAVRLRRCGGLRPPEAAATAVPRRAHRDRSIARELVAVAPARAAGGIRQIAEALPAIRGGPHSGDLVVLAVGMPGMHPSTTLPSSVQLHNARARQGHDRQVAVRPVQQVRSGKPFHCQISCSPTMKRPSQGISRRYAVSGIGWNVTHAQRPRPRTRDKAHWICAGWLFLPILLWGRRGFVRGSAIAGEGLSHVVSDQHQLEVGPDRFVLLPSLAITPGDDGLRTSRESACAQDPERCG